MRTEKSTTSKLRLVSGQAINDRLPARRVSVRAVPLSVTRGRVRWDVAALLGQHVLAPQLEARLFMLPEVTMAKVNSRTGRVLVHFKDSTQLAVIRNHLVREVERLRGTTRRVGTSATTSHVGEREPGASSSALPVLVGGVGVAAACCGLAILPAIGIGATVGGTLYLVQRSLSRVSDARSTSLLKRVSKPYRHQLSSALVLATAAVSFGLLRIVVLGALIDTVVYGNFALGLVTGSSAALLLAGTLACIGSSVLLRYASRLNWGRIARRVEHETRVMVYDHIQRLDSRHLNHLRRGDLAAVLGEDVNQIERGLDAAIVLLDVLLSSVALSVAIVTLSPSGGWLVLAPLPVMLLLSQAIQPRLNASHDVLHDSSSRLKSRISGNLEGLATIRSFAAEGQELLYVAADSGRVERASRGVLPYSWGYPLLLEGTTLLGMTVAGVTWGTLASLGGMTVGRFSSMIMAAGHLFYPFTRVGQELDTLQRMQTSLARIADVLEYTTERTNQTQALNAAPIRGDVVFEQVSFSYEPETVVLDAIDLRVEANTTVAIVGLSGSGKSTLCRLLLAQYQPNSGSIQIDGRPLTNFDPHALRRQIAVVEQDVFLFHRTVRENIAFGSPNATFEQVVHAARLAEADEFIRELPQAYETVVLDRGDSLSGGQRQRVALARALLKQAPILLLDEATAHLDPETQHRVFERLRRFVGPRTIINITHQMRSAARANKIVLVENGTVVEQGSHEELLRQKGRYEAFWRTATRDDSPTHQCSSHE